jgi:DNA-binding LacI/PurR family transcriptional regulator
MEDGGGQVLSLLSDDLYEPGNPSNQPRPSEIAALIRKLQTARPRPTGLFVMADNLLPATYAGLIASGIRPGIDLPVVCCNSESPYFAGLLPEPPRVDIPAEEIGRRAVDLLAWRTQNPQRQTSTTIFAPTLHIPEGCSFIS